MKNIFFFLAIVLLINTSCDNEIKINAEWQDVTVTYALLDPKQDTQWVRVERGWLGTRPASESYDEPDSLYYPSLTVVLEELVNGNVSRSTNLIKDTTSRSIEPGDITTEDYRIYRTDGNFTLDIDLEYRLRILKPDSEPITATTSIINGTGGIKTPYLDMIKPFETTFGGGVSYYLGEFDWESSSSYFYTSELKFYYTERNINGGPYTRKSTTIEFPAQVLKANLDYTVNSLKNTIEASIPQDPNVIRFFRKMTFKVSASSKDLYIYSGLNEPSTGIAQAKPQFTNVDGGIGLVSTKTFATRDSIVFSNPTAFQDFVLDDRICELNFAFIDGSGDTCTCVFIDGAANSRNCF